VGGEMNKQGVSSRPENNDLELRMRTCERCGVGLGTMLRSEYLERFVDGGESCPCCHKSAISDGQRKTPAWVCTVDLAKKYAVDANDLYDAVCRGYFTYWESEDPNAGPSLLYLREEDVARAYPLRVAAVEIVDQPLALVGV